RLGAFGRPLCADEVGSLAGRDADQQPPQVVAVVEPGESPLAGAGAEAVERLQGDILFVGHGPGPSGEVLAGAPDHRVEGARPESGWGAAACAARSRVIQWVTEPASCMGHLDRVHTVYRADGENVSPFVGLPQPIPIIV